MYTGHFSTALLFHSYNPSLTPFSFTFGVCIIDIVFGLLILFGLERIDLNVKGTSVDLYCPISHSLLGSVAISYLWGYIDITGKYFIPLFFSSFTHFIEDWFVHNWDLPLYPFSSIYVGGTCFHAKYPRAAFYLELILCILCSIVAWRRKILDNSQLTVQISLFLSIAYILLMHYLCRKSISGELANLLKKEQDIKKQRRMMGVVSLKAFVIPAIILGTLLKLPRIFKLFIE
ncbi:unnamed protein product [Rotaria sp. Silwood1]|nr:unnamed protein product [Rotaria sp. Silwood1]CAF1646966.1 unnamed protein product [Rotaria sp. Silwood1]